MQQIPRLLRRTATASDFRGIARTAAPSPFRGLSWNTAAIDEPITYTVVNTPSDFRPAMTHEQWTAISAGLKMLGEAHAAAVNCDTEKLAKLKQESDKRYGADKIAKFSRPKKEGWAGPGVPHVIPDDSVEVRARYYGNTISTAEAPGWFVTSAI